MVKATYGTGSSVMLNTGSTPIFSDEGLVTSLAWRADGKATYVLEGNINYTGSVIKWLADDLKLIGSSKEAGEISATANREDTTYLVPAFTGLGAPHWDMYARGVLVGITRGTRREHVVRAAQEAIAYQSFDLVRAIEKDTGLPLQSLKVDGGASRDGFLMQFQADILAKPVVRPMIRESTALGAAYLAGLAVGVWESQEELQKLWRHDIYFEPQMAERRREGLLAGWHKAVGRSLGWAE